jgi:hypothetical protein
MTRLSLLIALAGLLAGCPASDDDDSAVDLTDDDDATPPPKACVWGLEDSCADEVVDAPGATGDGFSDPERAVNGVRGGGAETGGTDVFSLGIEPDVDDTLVVRWSDRLVLNGPGIDLVVFENAFESGGGIFMDPTVVEVSLDGVQWVAFPHDLTAIDETGWSNDPLDWPGFAGRTPVLLHEEDNPVDPVDPGVAGGDGFDLDDLPAGEPADTIRSDGFMFVRLSSAAALLNPDTGEAYPRDPISNGADIDGVYAALLAEE